MDAKTFILRYLTVTGCDIKQAHWFIELRLKDLNTMENLPLVGSPTLDKSCLRSTTLNFLYSSISSGSDSMLLNDCYMFIVYRVRCFIKINITILFEMPTRLLLKRIKISSSIYKVFKDFVCQGTCIV